MRPTATHGSASRPRASATSARAEGRSSSVLTGLGATLVASRGRVPGTGESVLQRTHLARPAWIAQTTQLEGAAPTTQRAVGARRRRRGLALHRRRLAPLRLRAGGGQRGPERPRLLARRRPRPSAPPPARRQPNVQPLHVLRLSVARWRAVRRSSRSRTNSAA